MKEIEIIKENIKKIIGSDEQDEHEALLFLHLEEIHEDAKYISSLINKIINNEIKTQDNLHTTLIELKTSGRHLIDHLKDFQKPNEHVISKLDKNLSV